MYLQTISKVYLFGDTRKFKQRNNFSAPSPSSSKAKAYWNEQRICLIAVLRHKPQYPVEVVIFYVSCYMTRCEWRLYQRMLMTAFKLWCCQGCSPIRNDDGDISRKVLLVLLEIVEYEEQKVGGWSYAFLEFIFASVWGRYLLCRLNIYF